MSEFPRVIYTTPLRAPVPPVSPATRTGPAMATSGHGFTTAPTERDRFKHPVKGGWRLAPVLSRWMPSDPPEAGRGLGYLWPKVPRLRSAGGDGGKAPECKLSSHLPPCRSLPFPGPSLTQGFNRNKEAANQSTNPNQITPKHTDRSSGIHWVSFSSSHQSSCMAHAARLKRLLGSILALGIATHHKQK